MTPEEKEGQWELGDALRGNTVNHTVAVLSCKDRSKFTDTIGRPRENLVICSDLIDVVCLKSQKQNRYSGKGVECA
jgi:hypothetical protein